MVKIGEMGPILGISREKERDLLRRLSDSGWIVRLKRGVYLAPSRIPAGGKYSPGTGLILQKLLVEEGGGIYQICGPTAFNFYGFDDQIPSVTFVYNNLISGRRTIGNLAFQFIKLADARLGSTREVRSREGLGMRYSSKARTLMDAVYDWSRFNSLPRGFSWIRQAVEDDSGIPSELAETTIKYGNQATIRRIGYLLETLSEPSSLLDLFQQHLTASKSLIPWIPGKPARGTVNRTWGVIVNE